MRRMSPDLSKKNVPAAGVTFLNQLSAENPKGYPPEIS
jgi:hypothetical protein